MVIGFLSESTFMFQPNLLFLESCDITISYNFTKAILFNFQTPCPRKDYLNPGIIPVDASNQCVREGFIAGSVVTRPYDNGLPTGIPAGQEQNHLPRFHNFPHSVLKQIHAVMTGSRGYKSVIRKRFGGWFICPSWP